MGRAVGARPVSASILHRGGYRLRHTRAAVLARDGATCWRCGYAIDLTVDGNDPDGLTLGHVKPVKAGGSDDPSNLRPEHKRCNLAASAREQPPLATIATPVERE
jgi:5-methylcytosine-specific restriction endonuclease McrA